MKPPSHMRSVVDRNVVMRRIPVLFSVTLGPVVSSTLRLSQPQWRIAGYKLDRRHFEVSKQGFEPLPFSIPLLSVQPKLPKHVIWFYSEAKRIKLRLSVLQWLLKYFEPFLFISYHKLFEIRNLSGYRVCSIVKSCKLQQIRNS